MTGASGRWPLPLLLLLCLPVNGESPGSSGSHPRQTVPQATGTAQATGRMADDRLLPALEASLLGVFGLPRRPRPSGSTQIPNYMKELYQNQVQSRTRPHRQGHLRAHGRGPVQANTVRSFYHTDLQSSPDCPQRTCHRLWFNMSTLPPAELLTYAELRVFADQPALRQASTSSKGRVHKTRVEVHEIMQPAGQDSDSIVRLLDTRPLGLSGEPWESFDVHPAVLKWQRTPHMNHGLEVRVVSDSPAVSTDTHVRLRRSAGDAHARWQSERPLLVTYTDDGKGANSRVKRSSGSGASGGKDGDKKKGRRKRENAKRERRRRRRGRNRKRKNRKKGERRRRKHKNQCRRHALYVDFSDVGWNDWIVAPTGYNAYYCSGECNFPLADHLNSTNHAIVQTLVNSVNPSAVPKACCVPTELSAISMLYLDEYDMVVLKNYQDMVVEACGCR